MIRDSSDFTVSSHFIRLLTDYAEGQKLSLAKLLSQHGIDTAAINDTDARIDFASYNKLFDGIAHELNDEHLGLHLGPMARLTHLGTGGLAQIACSNMRELLPRMARYNSLNIDAFEDDIDVEGNELVLRWRSRLPATTHISRHHAELNFSMTLSFVPQFTGEHIVPTRVWFRHPRPQHSQILDDFFGCAVRFDAPVDLLACDASVLDFQLHPPDPATLQVLDQICERQLKAIEALKEPDWLAVTKQTISKSLRDGQPELAKAAAAAGLAARQLRRRLAGRGLNFRMLVDEQRRELAQAYIADPALSLVEVAMLLGFSDQSAFQRAFRRWTGEAPGSARRKLTT